MKNTVRAHQNGATKRTPSQVQTIEVKSKFGPEFDLPKNATHHACLALFDRDGQELVGKIPLDESEFDKIWDLAARTAAKIMPQLPRDVSARFSTRDVIAGWLRQILRNASMVNEINAAKAQSHALHWLLIDAMNRSGGGTYGEEIQLGITELTIQTQDRLDKVCDEVTS